MRKLLQAGCAAAILLTLGLPAHAAIGILSDRDVAQLAAWLGEGRLSLQSLYSKAAGDTALNFHNAVDGKGRTFTVMWASNEQGQRWLIGGYNPQSWGHGGSYNITPRQVDRTAFLFNLNTGVLRRQTPASYVIDSAGAYQTYNGSDAGPTWGVGHDLYVPPDLTHGGVSSLYSYIDPVQQDMRTSLLDGSVYDHPNITFGALEVYSIQTIPELNMGYLLAVGLAVAGAAVRRHGLGTNAP